MLRSVNSLLLQVGVVQDHPTCDAQHHRGLALAELCCVQFHKSPSLLFSVACFPFSNELEICHSFIHAYTQVFCEHLWFGAGTVQHWVYSSGKKQIRSLPLWETKKGTCARRGLLESLQSIYLLKVLDHKNKAEH